MWPEHHSYHGGGVSMSRVQRDLHHQNTGQENSIPADMLRTITAQSRQLRVAVVGAGFAGLRAADVLLQHGVQVTIYEARNRLGGRVAQSNHLGYTVDLGPNWIHGSKKNPIMQIAEATQTQLHAWDEEQLLYGTDGQIIDANEAAEYARLIWEDGVIADAFRYSERHHETIDPEQSLYDYFMERVAGLFVQEPQAVAKRKHETLLHMAKMWGAYVGDSVTTQSLKFFWLEECIEGENPFVAGTYAKILNEVARPAKESAMIHLETRVTGISAIENPSSNSGARVSVKTSAADHDEEYDEVIVTSPLGWLKRNKAVFTPPLAPRLSQAIDSVGYGNLDKVYITFPSAFWNTAPASNTTFSTGGDPNSTTPNIAAPTIPLHQPQPDNPKSASHPPGFIHWLSPTYASSTNPQAWDLETINLAALPPASAHPTLLFYIYGACAKHIASLAAACTPSADERVLAFFHPYITRLPNYSPTDPACTPTAVLATAWANDELAGYGSYSNFQTGLVEGDGDVEVMRHGMPERGLWLAGEHTAPFIALGTATGAYWAGEKVAERICGAYGLSGRGK